MTTLQNPVTRKVDEPVLDVHGIDDQQAPQSQSDTIVGTQQPDRPSIEKILDILPVELLLEVCTCHCDAGGPVVLTKFQIFQWLHPIDLLHLVSTNKYLHSLLNKRESSF